MELQFVLWMRELCDLIVKNNLLQSKAALRRV